MTQLLVLRERIKKFYQKYDLYINPAVKFLVALLVFIVLNNKLGYDSRLGRVPILLGLSVVCAFTPASVIVIIAAAFTIIQIYANSMFLAFLSVIILLIIYLLFVRFTPKQGYVLLAVPVLYMLNIPYAVPILLGLVATPLSIIPMSCGVFIYYYFNVIQQVATSTAGRNSIDDIMALYKTVVDGIIGNEFMLLTICIFAVVLLLTYFLRNLQANYAFEISIASGGVATIILFLVGDLVIDSSELIFKMIIGTILSCIIVYIVQFFRVTLEYSRVERVQFEDEQYYYYVKAVPKMNVTTPEMNVKFFSTPRNAKEAMQSLKKQESSSEEAEVEMIEYGNQEDEKEE